MFGETSWQKEAREREAAYTALQDAKYVALDRAWEEIGVPREPTNPHFRGLLQNFVFKNPDALVSENLDRAVEQCKAWGLPVVPEILAAKERLDAVAAACGKNPIVADSVDR